MSLQALSPVYISIVHLGICPDFLPSINELFHDHWPWWDNFKICPLVYKSNAPLPNNLNKALNIMWVGCWIDSSSWYKCIDHNFLISQAYFSTHNLTFLVARSATIVRLTSSHSSCFHSSQSILHKYAILDHVSQSNHNIDWNNAKGHPDISEQPYTSEKDGTIWWTKMRANISFP